MAYQKKTGGRDFQKGHVPPHAKMSKEVREMRQMSITDFIRAAREIMHLTPTESEKLLEDPKTPNYKVIILKIIKRGHYKDIDRMFNRLFGRVPEKLEVDNKHSFANEVDRIAKNLSRTDTEKLRKALIDNEDTKNDKTQ